MPQRSDVELIKDIAEAGRRVVEYCSGLTYQDFIKDIRTQDTVVRKIEIIGEAAKNISENIRERYPVITDE